MTFKTNESEFLAVPIPEDSNPDLGYGISADLGGTFLFIERGFPNNPVRINLLDGKWNALGLFFTKEKRLDFDAELIPLEPTLTGSTRTNSEYHAEVVSMILSELKKEFPLEVNPHGNKEQYLVTACEPGDLSHLLQEWRLAQSQVLPDRVLILRLIAAGGTRVSASAVGDK